MARLSGTVLKNAKPVRGVPFVTGPIPALPPQPADDRNWQQKFRDWGNSMGERLLGPHLNEALGRAGQAVQFTDAGDMMDAANSSAILGQAVKDGRYWDAAKEAPWTLAATAFAAAPGLSVGPADNMAKEAVQGARKAPKLTPDVLPKKSIRAFHGSPHDFDRFSMDKIGTGEGAQAYGHGLYFAENEGVARGYRDALSRPLNTGDLGRDLANYAVTQKRGSVEDAIAYLNREMANYNNRPAGWPSPEYKKQYEDALGILTSGNWKPAGRMYEVEINADPEQFLDWDKPLREQPEAVQKAFSGIDKSINARGDQYWPSQYEDMGEWYNHFKGKQINAPQVSERLREAGIPGIKYLDAGSRGAGDGTRNYVVFDDNLINIIRKYGIAGASAMLGYNLLEGMNEAQAAELKKYEPKRLTPETLKSQKAVR